MAVKAAAGAMMDLLVLYVQQGYLKQKEAYPPRT